MFADQSPTPLDLNFRIGPFPVRVSPWFFLGMAFIGFGSTRGPLGLLALPLFILAGFISILIHELGHAVTARFFGRPSRIALIMFGGYAEYYDGQPRAGWQRLITALAGPAAGLSFALLLYVSELSTDWAGKHPILAFLFVILLILNIVWSLFNLFPIWPLDGGKALREVLYLIGLRQPDVPTHYAGLVGAACLSAVGVFAYINPNHQLLRDLPYIPSLIMAFFFGLMAYQNWQMLQIYQRYGGGTLESEEERWRGYQ